MRQKLTKIALSTFNDSVTLTCYYDTIIATALSNFPVLVILLVIYFIQFSHSFSLFHAMQTVFCTSVK